MLKIELNHVLFYATHGLYPIEKKLGNTFEVDAWVSYTPKKLPVKNISETIDYTAVFDLIKSYMEKREKLLETLVTRVSLALLKRFDQAEEVYISIRKLQPPIPGFSGSTGVSFQLKRKDLKKA